MITLRAQLCLTSKSLSLFGHQFLFFSSSSVYKSPKGQVEEDELDYPITVAKTALFYSPPKPKFAPITEGRGRINTTGSDSSMTELIIPEEDSDLRIPEQPEGKYSNKDNRNMPRHKHRRHERPKKGGEVYNLESFVLYFLCFVQGVVVNQGQFLRVADVLITK